MVDTDDTRHMTAANDGRRTTPRVWHKLPTGELIKITGLQFLSTSVPRFNYSTGRICQLRRFWWAIIGHLYENDNFLLIYCHCG